ncbi:LAETG motif-containing sortase-dependent surface protein [Streptomyces sp. NPDC014986]|uniref:excalibur calcium-binding domain-containing protein n=1 Tax=Streptomyces sp. NPDC014986 TaxID=3364934 RepID=UPI0036FE3651
MNPFHKSAAVAVAALALAALPVTAEAHGGNTPFENCSEAYANGHAHIPVTSGHYGKHLDRDGDGIGCDRPPADFVPATEDDDTGDTGTGDGAGSTGTDTGADDRGGGTDLAETGGSDATPYIAAGGAAVLLAGGGVLFTARRRRGNR